MPEKVQSFRDLLVWQQAVELAVVVYRFTAQFPSDERYGLSSQLRRAAVSISSNIAEGFRRALRADKVNFYRVALASLAEVESQVEVARKLTYVTEAERDKIQTSLDSVARLLQRLISSAGTRV